MSCHVPYTLFVLTLKVFTIVLSIVDIDATLTCSIWADRPPITSSNRTYATAAIDDIGATH
ncbi:hypothetical protein BDZ89DRAFT_1057247 [Hymenopellis radicata]|nr:hypothetical protein BDZ89DRAFT_1057247 [Hymenopellis radicata]